MTQGAGQAAMVAIQRHNQQQNQATPRQGTGAKQTVRRANSLTAASNRSNSLRSYTYHPKPSYTVGQPLGSSNQGARRFNSLNSKSSVGSYNRPGARAASLSSQNSFVRSRSPPVLYEQDNEGEDEGDITVTTKTTKVVDSQGRVLSITVETIKTFADGSTVTNTTTKNISRSNSRANSLNSQSMALKGNNSVKHNSMLSNGAGGSYNLSKIDEDLQDFDYNYELDHDILTQKGHGHPHVDDVLHEPAHDENFQGQSLRLNQGNHGLSYYGDDFGSPELHSYGGGNESIHSTGIKSVSSESSKPLKSILKKKNNINDKGPEDEEGFADAIDELQTDKQLDIKQDDVQHPYKSLSSPQFNEPPKFKVPQSPNMHVSQQSNRINTNAGSKRTHSLMSSPISRHDDVLSDKSEASNSIKFLEKHETIPIFYNDSEPKETEHTKPSDQDFYSIAMQVAMERVYGNKDSQPQSQSPKLGGQRAMSLNSQSLPTQDSKKEKKTQELNEQGVNDNYVYQNHHKDFVGLSLRDNVEPKQTSRKERAKEEKKQQKSELKEQKQKMKNQEKEESEASKAVSKEQKKSQRAQKHGRLASLFGRRKSTSNDDSNLVDERGSNKFSNDNSQPIVSDTNLTEDNTKATDLEGYQKLNHNNSGQDEVSRAGDNFRREGAAGAATFNPEMQRRLLGISNTGKDRRQINNDTSNPNGDQNNSYFDDNRNLGSKIHDEVNNNSNLENAPTLGATRDHDNSFTNAPSRPVFNNDSNGSYSMRFPRNDSARSDIENLANMPNIGDNASLNMSSSQNQNTEGSNAGHEDFQDMPGSMPGVDSSILNAIVKDDTEAGPSFGHDVNALKLKTTLDPSANIANDRASVYSNDPEEKRKGKVLDPITVPVLNEIKSETASIESQSNKNRDIGTELESTENIETDELLDSDNVVDYSEPTGKVFDEGIEEKKGNSSQTLQDSFDNKVTAKSDIVTNESNNDGLIDGAVLVNQDDVKGYNESNALTNDADLSNLTRGQHSQEQTATLGNQTNTYPVVADSNNRTLNSTYGGQEEFGRDTEYGKFSTQKLDSEITGDAFATANKDVDVSPPFVNESLEYANDKKNLNLSNNETTNYQSQDLQAARPINDEVANNGIVNEANLNVTEAATQRDQSQSTSYPKSSFEHMQREESGSPVVVHNDHAISETKPSKKGNKFKHKLFKYFVNSYNN
ncbi:uncharacterized protein AC631_00782 [Debaryomyces fabryi]|uniref:Uncharacterized protein n=1 Tax=Debaryomyces fabryi TaxID=58627 RepID=A0A0V1Q528_9ASCO|nr:uncharacterized protein AC631_00782 [Debaryomyces fabryi]KSA03466.1 hypothetical protein AC631_00782 [Debaryomyces fabryi]